MREMETEEGEKDLHDDVQPFPLPILLLRRHLHLLQDTVDFEGDTGKNEVLEDLLVVMLPVYSGCIGHLRGVSHRPAMKGDNLGFATSKCCQRKLQGKIVEGSKSACFPRQQEVEG